MNSKLIMNVDNEYAKNPNLKKDDINALMEWADKQAHLPRITGDLIKLFTLLIFK